MLNNHMAYDIRWYLQYQLVFTMPQPDKVKKGRRNAQQLLQSNKFEEALLELDQEGEEFEKAKKNPKQWLKDRGVQLPGNPDTVEIKEGSCFVRVCWNNWCITVSW